MSVLEGGYGSQHIHRKRHRSEISHSDSSESESGPSSTEETDLSDIYAGGLDRRELADNCVQHVAGLLAKMDK